MKKKLLAMLIVATICISCERKYKRMTSFVEKTHIDSCQYDKEGSIVYFSGDTVAIYYSDTQICMGSDTLSNKNDAEVYQKIAGILKEKWPVPEIYSSVCIRRFNQFLEKEEVDSCFLRKVGKTSYYTFFLSEEKIVSIIVNGFFLSLKPNDDIYMYTDKKGKCMDECTDAQFEWPKPAKQKILDILIAKSKQKHPVSVEKQCRPIRSLFTKEELLTRLK
ncbi:MAG: hypothetical protein WCH65_00440 [bacterium]